LSDGPEHGVHVAWSPDASDGRFDVVLTDRRRWTGLLPARSPGLPASAERATDPMAAIAMQQLGMELAKTLRDRLPDVALPAAVLAVSAMPSLVPGQGGR